MGHAILENEDYSRRQSNDGRCRLTCAVEQTLNYRNRRSPRRRGMEASSSQLNSIYPAPIVDWRVNEATNHGLWICVSGKALAASKLLTWRWRRAV